MRGAASSRRCVGSLDDASGRQRVCSVEASLLLWPQRRSSEEPVTSFGSSARQGSAPGSIRREGEKLTLRRC
jgi:hypothetical protein